MLNSFERLIIHIYSISHGLKSIREIEVIIASVFHMIILNQSPWLLSLLNIANY